MAPTATHVPHPASPAPHDSDARALTHESTALTRARANLHYLVAPSSASAPRPASLRLRLLLRSLHAIGTFIFWRLYRWAKYAAIGSLVAAVGSVAIAGSVASGAAVFLAPTGILGTVGAGTLWGLGRWGWRRVWRARNRRTEEEGRRKGGVVAGGEDGGGGGGGAFGAKEEVVAPW